MAEAKKAKKQKLQLLHTEGGMGSRSAEAKVFAALALVGTRLPFTAPRLLTASVRLYKQLKKVAATIETVWASALPRGASATAAIEFVEHGCDVFLKDNVDDWVAGRALGARIHMLRAASRTFLTSQFAFAALRTDTDEAAADGAEAADAPAAAAAAAGSRHASSSSSSSSTAYNPGTLSCARPSPTFAPGYSDEP